MKLLNLRSIGLVSKIAVVLIVLKGLSGAGSARAAVVDLYFSGTYIHFYDMLKPSLFGSTNWAFTYQITYDTSLGELLSNNELGSLDVNGDKWYGYSASGVTFTNLTFGTQTWTMADLQSQRVLESYGFDQPALWFNKPLDSSTLPTESAILFNDLQGHSLSLGLVDQYPDAWGGIGGIAYGDGSQLGEYPGTALSGELIISNSSPSPVPLPPSLLLFGSGLLGLAGWRRFRKS